MESHDRESIVRIRDGIIFQKSSPIVKDPGKHDSESGSIADHGFGIFMGLAADGRTKASGEILGVHLCLFGVPDDAGNHRENGHEAAKVDWRKRGKEKRSDPFRTLGRSGNEMIEGDEQRIAIEST